MRESEDTTNNCVSHHLSKLVLLIPYPAMDYLDLGHVKLV